MGGVQVNGCGARDYFTKVKNMGVRECSNCGKTAPFYLEKSKYKATVFFIPAFTLKERYAVMCESCETGIFIEDSDAYKIMNDEMTLKDIFEPSYEQAAAQICPICGAEMEGAFCGKCGAKYEEPKPSGRICASCGAEVEGAFCGKCGTKYVEPIIEEPTPTVRICANCGAEVTAAFCGMCGTKYEEPEPTVRICANCGAEVEAIFCGNCGTKYQDNPD